MEEEFFAQNLECSLEPVFSKDFELGSFSKKANEFTYNFSGMLEMMDYFGWIMRNSHGVHSSTGLPDYLVWSSDSEACGSDILAIKEGNKITYKHMPGHGWHNIMINTSKILNYAACAYLLTGDKLAGKIVEQYCKGLSATIKGMVYDSNDSEHYLMARNIIPLSHEYSEIDGGVKSINYENWKTNETHWNAQRFNYKNNPCWGDIYLTNTRSKDDLPHILRAAAFLPEIINCSSNPKIVRAAYESYRLLRGFCKDIILNNFNIRTKDSSGKTFIPKGDLISFSKYGKNSENNAKIAISLLGLGELGKLNANKSFGGIYETAAVNVNYYNYKIINGFHMAALLHSYSYGCLEASSKLLNGLVGRADWLMNSSFHKKARSNLNWMPDLAVFLVKAASCGMPLKKIQKEIIYSEFSKAIDHYSDFRRWNLWDDSVPDGSYGSSGGYIPNSKGLVNPIDLGVLLEYAHSPYKIGEPIINPEIIMDTK
ncbi:MAG: hypothetical protein PHN56_05845 [Candidatus Nanoarchaeia archaeon]|nr:hypothetical protein [Candidatus Nanoarchaeia archaeon]